jgi:hypothetical protein
MLATNGGALLKYGNAYAGIMALHKKFGLAYWPKTRIAVPSSRAN